MIPVFLPVRSRAAAGAGFRGRSGGGGYPVLIFAIAGLLALLGIVLAIVWIKPASRRSPSWFVETLALDPIVAGTLERIGADPHYQVSGAQGTTQWWRRHYEERWFVVTTTLAGPQVAPFLSAVRDSLEQRVLATGATRRGLQSIAWPDSGSAAEPRGPALVSMPYATRRRVGWISIQATHGSDGLLTMSVLVHEGPRPTD
jgi:hypothetical protein